MVSYVSALLYGVGGLVVAGMALLVALQERLVYVPVLPGLTKSYPITPARLRLPYEDVWLRSSDGVRLHAWFIKLFPDSRGPIRFPFYPFFLLLVRLLDRFWFCFEWKIRVRWRSWVGVVGSDYVYKFGVLGLIWKEKMSLGFYSIDELWRKIMHLKELLFDFDFISL